MTAAVALDGIKYPSQHDFLLGRGGETNNHSGNILFRQFIRDSKEAYQTAPKTQKPLISQQLVAKWRNLDPPGRFLERCEDDKTWKDVGDAVACRKTSKALGERGKRSKSGDDPTSPGSIGMGPMGGANLSGNKRKMGEGVAGPSARSYVLNTASASSVAGGPTDVSSLLHRLTGGVGAAPALPESSVSALLGGTNGNGAGGIDLASLLQWQQAPSPTALLLAQAQQQQQREALLRGFLQQPGVTASSTGLQQQLLSSNAQGGSSSLASLLSAPAPPPASSTPLADALAAAMSNRRSAASTPASNEQLMDIALARHILSSASSNPPAAASAHSTASSLEDLLRLRQLQQQQQLQQALGGEEAKAAEVPRETATMATTSGTRTQAESFHLLQLLNNQNQLLQQQASDPAATLAALRRTLGNNSY